MFQMINLWVCNAGCCFVTFYKRKDALQAQNDMHNIKSLVGVSGSSSSCSSYNNNKIRIIIHLMKTQRKNGSEMN